MLRTTKKLALILILIFAVISIAEAAEQKRPVQAKRSASQQTQDTIYVQKVNAFLKDPRWIPGTDYGSSQKPKLSTYSCVGCCAYAADFVAYVFGKSSPRSGTEFRNLAQVRAGDILVLSGPPHWIVVLSRNGNTLTTTEGNWMGKVAAVKGAYTINGNTLMRNGKKFRTFSLGYHYM